MIRRPPRSTLFPYTTLFRSESRLQLRVGIRQQRRRPVFIGDAEPAIGDLEADRLGVVDLLVAVLLQALIAEIDRKSTRLNSSHLGISYAVFCLKKKKKSANF